VVVSVVVATETTPEIVEAVGRLLPLLSSSPAPSAEQVAEIVGSPATTLFVARDGDDGPIVGILTLAIFRIPSGVRAWIEDVIVSEEARGQGCGEALSLAAVAAAQAAGARSVDLTSRPSRAAANRLYERIGFVRRETNVYRYGVDG
jgi:ribosomal protein S18 acetylase RimI-like enzyme